MTDKEQFLAACEIVKDTPVILDLQKCSHPFIYYLLKDQPFKPERSPWWRLCDKLTRAWWELRT